MTTEEEEEGEDNEASSLGSGRRGQQLVHMKTEAVEAADRDVRKIVSRKSSAKNSDRSQKSRISILDNSSPSKVGEAEKAD